jgi:putative two-component system response regulator
VSALLALSEAIEARDPYTRGHSARVARMAHAVGVRLGCDEGRLALLRLGGALHDVGKLVVSEAVLTKPGPLTEDEVAEVRCHPEAGARMVALARGLRPALPGVLYHHITTSAGTAAAIRPVEPAPRSHSRRASWRSSTASTR